jgi:hypothetical protein
VWQTADRAAAKIADLGLCKQPIITNFSHPFFARLLVLRPMIFLTFNAAIFHEFASGAQLQFHIIPSLSTTGGTHLLNCLLYAAAAAHHGDIITAPSRSADCLLQYLVLDCGFFRFWTVLDFGEWAPKNRGK